MIGAGKSSVMVLLTGVATLVFAQQNRIHYNAQNLFLSGANVAWLNFAKDLGPGATDFNTFADMFLGVHDHGGNAMRLWLHTDGTNSPAFDAASLVAGPGAETISDLRRILDLAWEREVGLVLCLWSFDMLRASNDAVVVNRNLLLLTDPAHTRAYLNNCLIPMVDSLRSHPAIIAWEIFNEPEGMSQEFGWSGIKHVPMSAIQRFINLCAGAIHRADPAALVTSGAWSFISLSDATASIQNQNEPGMARMSLEEKQQIAARFNQKYRSSLSVEEAADYLGRITALANYNYYSDDRLLQAGGDPAGTLDFYSVHYYDWAGTALSPFHHHQSRWELDKPLVVAEFAMRNTFGVDKERLFETLYQNGYAGALAWSWTDTNFSSHQDMLKAMHAMWASHRLDVDVNGVGGDWPLVAITRPANNSMFAEGASVAIEAAAFDPDGAVVSVEFFASDTVKIGEAFAPPYAMIWKDISSNIYTLTAVATDDRGHRRTSERVSIKVGVPPVVRLEAERAARTGTPAPLSDLTASNGACLRTQQTGTITWRLPEVPAAGNYEIAFGYRLPYDTPKLQYLNVNGRRIAEVLFDGSMNVWLEKKLAVNLIPGNNTIQMELSWGWMDFDYLGVPRSLAGAIEDSVETPSHFFLQQNHPNPFNAMTTIIYSLPREEQVKLVAYNSVGREIRVLVDARQKAGLHQVFFEGGNLASGTYFYRIKAGPFVDEKRMLLVK